MLVQSAADESDSKVANWDFSDFVSATPKCSEWILHRFVLTVQNNSCPAYNGGGTCKRASQSGIRQSDINSWAACVLTV